LDKAEEMYQKGLELDQALGRKEGMAAKYGNLGIVLGVTQLPKIW
jgi:protein O-GlcNAc transferase